MNEVRVILQKYHGARVQVNFGYGFVFGTLEYNGHTNKWVVGYADGQLSFDGNNLSQIEEEEDRVLAIYLK